MLFVRLQLAGRDLAANPITTCDIEVFTAFGGYEGASSGGSGFGGGGSATVIGDTEVFPADGDTAIAGGWLHLEVDCTGRLWMNDVLRIGWVGQNDTLLHEVVTLPEECGGVADLTKCNIKAFTIDNEAGHMYVVLRGTSRVSVQQCTSLTLNAPQLLRVCARRHFHRDSYCEQGWDERPSVVQAPVLRIRTVRTVHFGSCPGSSQPSDLCHHVRVCARCDRCTTQD